MRRIVFIAHDGVLGNARVQKQARAAAECGWQVFVLGRKGAGEPVAWHIGDVEVRLVPNPRPLATSMHMMRAAPLRAPLAYRPLWKPAYQAQSVRARQDDLAHRRAQLKTDAGSGALLRRLRSKRLAAETLATEALRRWVELRTGQMRRLQARRRSANRPIDRFVMAWWERWMGARAWSRLDPGLWDYEVSFGPAIDALDPDVVHASGSRLLHVGARAVIRARARDRDAKLVWDAHAFAPFDRPGITEPRRHLAQCLQEREYAPLADRVTTLSDGLADLIMREYALPRRPTVIKDAPALGGEDQQAGKPVDVRTRCDLDQSTPLLVYTGRAAAHRGLDTVVDSLPDLDGVHVAFVVESQVSPYVRRLSARARRLGVEDRVHLLPYVEHDQVVGHIATADVGIDSSHRCPHEEVALPARFYEYSSARLPVVVGDVEATSRQVAATGQGEIFRVRDTDDFVRAVRTVLVDPERYRAAYEKPGTLDSWTWESQAVVLGDVLAQLAPSPDGRR